LEKIKKPQAEPLININATMEATRQHGGMIRLKRIMRRMIRGKFLDPSIKSQVEI
jgi:hypothetical protein